MTHGLVIGLQYGDEGKGRVSAYFMEKDKYDWNVRFNGANNAGHTVYHNGQKYALHHLPAGSVSGKKVALDSGMAINLEVLGEELDKVPVKDLYISENVNIITQEHMAMDCDGSGVGSTKRGVAYVYADRALRKGKRVKDLLDHSIGSHRFNVYRGSVPLQSTERALFESAQGIMLDVDYGAYPWVTSSSVFPRITYDITDRIGVMKAYTSRVGEGPPDVPLVPELTELGQEYGTTTGRPRKCTWAIMDELRYTVSLLRPTKMVVTKLDILDNIPIKVWDEDRLYTIGDLDNYKSFLVEQFPQITHFSESPDGDLIKL